MEKKAVTSKSLNKSTAQQIQALVNHMEEYPHFARGTPVYGSSKQSIEEQWWSLSQKLNSLGPPKRTVCDWKKTWADLKSRTKRKIADSKTTMRATGGGLFNDRPLTLLEQQVDRTLFLSSSAAPMGKNFADDESVEESFKAIVESPPRCSKSVAVVTPSRKSGQNVVDLGQQITSHLKASTPPHTSKEVASSPLSFNNRPNTSNSPKTSTHPATLQEKWQCDDKPSCSSAKKKRTTTVEQLSLIQRQIEMGERANEIAQQQLDATKMLGNTLLRIANIFEKLVEKVELQPN